MQLLTATLLLMLGIWCTYATVPYRPLGFDAINNFGTYRQLFSAGVPFGGGNCNCPPGPPGLPGPTGQPGPDGDAGEKGPTGDPGDVGPLGKAGERGHDGRSGPSGPIGESGRRGPRGFTGGVGIAGARGPLGVPGPRGLPGAAAVAARSSYYNPEDFEYDDEADGYDFK